MVVYSPSWASKLLDVKMGRVYWILSGLRVPIANSCRKCMVFGMETFLQLPLPFLAKLEKSVDLVSSPRVRSSVWFGTVPSCSTPGSALWCVQGVLYLPTCSSHSRIETSGFVLFVWDGHTLSRGGWPSTWGSLAQCYTFKDWSMWFYKVIRFLPI